METRELDVELRTKTGKGICRQLRKQQRVPGVVYGKGMESVPVTLNAKQLTAAISGEGGQNHLLTLKGGGALDGSVIIVADVLRATLKNNLRHVDLHKVDLTHTIRVEVAVRLIGTAIGVKEGGLLDLAMHAVQVECLPHQIPEHLDIDVTPLGIGQSLHVSDLQLPAGLKVLDDPKSAIISILGKAREEAPAVA